MTKLPTPAFLSVFMEAVAEQYRWAAGLDFRTAVENCVLEENRESVLGVFLRHNYLPADITTVRLQACVKHIFPVPTTFKAGDKVRYIGSDLKPYFPSEDTVIIITDVNAAVTASEYSYSAGGIAWIPHTDLEFVAPADDESIETAWFTTQTEEDPDDLEDSGEDLDTSAT